MRDNLLELMIESGNQENRKDITKQLAILPVNETSDLKTKLVTIKKIKYEY
jgi:hypothetical protein